MERKFRDAVADRSEVETELGKSKTRVADLELELHSVDRHAKRLETDKNIVLKTADREMEEAKDELEKSRHELEDLDLTIAQLRAVRSFLCIQRSNIIVSRFSESCFPRFFYSCSKLDHFLVDIRIHCLRYNSMFVETLNEQTLLKTWIILKKSLWHLKKNLQIEYISMVWMH